LYEKQARLQKFIGPTDRSLRARAIQSLAKKFNYEEEHALKVTELAVELFNQLSAYHDLGVLEKEILQYAAILHDIGKFIHVSSHHKHGQYIIANSNLSGFTTTELLVISNIVRYHRKAGPKGDHPNYQVLSIKDRRTILILAGILRVADNLDRGHRNYVSHLFANVSETKIEIEVFAKHEIEMEIAAATENADLLSEAFGRKIEIVQKE
jgi:exopolyphosphatase/guanosine-5'-triphosphate,3'-diphosphate pyrophosphatase